MGGFVRRARRFAAAIAMVTVGVSGTVVVTEGVASAQGQFMDGQIAKSTIVNCFSIISQINGGVPYTEDGAWLWGGGFADSAQGIPTVNQTFYMHVVVGGVGNACSGQYMIPAFSLPAGVSLDTNVPILCFVGGQQAVVGSNDCPQWDHLVTSTIGGSKMFLSTDNARGGLWPLPAGATWEFRFPVKAGPTAVPGSNFGYFAKILDGNSSPVLSTTGQMWVFGTSQQPVAQAAYISYEAKSTVRAAQLPGTAIPTRYGFYSFAAFNTFGRDGTLIFQLGTDGVNYPQQLLLNPNLVLPQSLTNYDTVVISFDWDDPQITSPPITPGQTYHWRAAFRNAANNQITYGRDQTFTIPTSMVCNGKSVTVALGLGQAPTAGADVIMGTPKAEVIRGLGGNDTICGGGGNDTFQGGAGNDTIIGGAGKDTIDFSDLAGPISLVLGSTGGGTAGGDTFSNIENVIGTAAADAITGNAVSNVLVGLGGADVLKGVAGNDTLVGGLGNDVLQGGDGVDTVAYQGGAAVTVNLGFTTSQNTVGAGSDRITTAENIVGSGAADTLTGNGLANRIDGQGGNDKINGGAGGDVLVGGAGTDTVSYATASIGVKVSLALTSTQNTVGSGSDKLATFENLTGSPKNDVLTGNAGKNVLNGGTGTDTCNGGAGTDSAVSCEVKTGIP